MKRTIHAPLVMLVIALLAACAGGDTADGARTGLSVAALSTPAQAPLPVNPTDGEPSWDGTRVELMFADALAACTYEVHRKFIGWDGAHLEVDFNDDAFIEYIRGKMVGASCHYGDTAYKDERLLPEAWWFDQRNDEECNRHTSTSTKKSAGLARAERLALDVPVELPFEGALAVPTAMAARRALAMPITNLCVAQHLRSRSPGVSGGEALLLSGADQRQLLVLTKERAQMAMLQFALLGRTLATPRLAQPELVSNADLDYRTATGAYPLSFIPMLQQWAQGGGATDDVLRKLGEDFATAVLLHVTASTELAQALTRTGAAHLPRGASVRDPRWAATGRLDASVDTWGPGAWRERALASLYGGDPLVEDALVKDASGRTPESGSTPWKHFLKKRGPGDTGQEAHTEWPDVGDASFVSARVKDPKVHELLSLATRADALYLRKTDLWVEDPMSRYECRDVDVDASAKYLYWATEAHLRTSLCSNFQLDAGAPPDSGTCQPVAVEDIPSDTSEASFELWSRYRISFQHARELAAYLKDLIGKECRRDRLQVDVTGTPTPPTSMTFWNRGARDFSGQISSVTLPGGGEQYHLADFVLRERGLPETAGLYSRYAGFFIPPRIYPEADPATQGFSGGRISGGYPGGDFTGAEEIRQDRKSVV